MKLLQNCPGTSGRIDLSSCFSFLVIAAMGCGLAEESIDTPVPGRSHFAANKTVEYVPGTLPVILGAPHGGRLDPAQIPDRSEGVFVTDGDTDILAKDLAGAIHRRTGQYPHLIICHLKRSKVDCNREPLIGTGGNPAAMDTWEAFHACIERARTTGRELYLDIHGHSHPKALVELGYQLSSQQLKESGSDLARLEERTGIAALAKTSRDSFEERLRGATSFGALLEARGFPAVPSPGHPHPGDEPYFSGGFNVERYRAKTPREQFIAMQVECPRRGVRDSPANRKRFAEAFAESLEIFLEHHAGIRLSEWNAPGEP